MNTFGILAFENLSPHPFPVAQHRGVKTESFQCMQAWSGSLPDGVVQV